MANATRLYDDYSRAQHAVDQLEAAGVPSSDISIVANNSEGWFKGRIDRDGDGVDDRAEGAGAGAGVGAGLGGAVGLLTGLGIMAIPGVGPIVAAGWLAATAVGAVAGGATGGIVGALTQAGVKDEDAHVYSEGVRRGGTMVSVRTNAKSQSDLDQLLGQSTSDWSTRANTWRKEGWTKFDPTAQPMTLDEIKADRARYR